MMDYVTITNESNGESLSISYHDPANGYMMTDTEGLGPLENSVLYSEYADQPGAGFQSVKPQLRQIIFHIELLHDGSIAAKRKQLYKLVSSGALTMSFVTDEDTYTITGRRETIEGSMFGEDNIYIVTVLCMDPYFTVGEGTGVVTGPIKLGLVDESYFTLVNEGDIAVGAKFHFVNKRSVLKTIESITVVNADGNNTALLNASMPGLQDNFTYDSRIGHRGTFLNEQVNNRYFYTFYNNWSTLLPGDNTIIIAHNYNVTNAELTVTHYPKVGFI